MGELPMQRVADTVDMDRFMTLATLNDYRGDGGGGEGGGGGDGGLGGGEGSGDCDGGAGDGPGVGGGGAATVWWSSFI